jgi:hypothetical protein
MSLWLNNTPVDSLGMHESGGLPFIPDAEARATTDAINAALRIAAGEYYDPPQWRPLATDTESRASTPPEKADKENEQPDILLPEPPSSLYPVTPPDPADLLCALALSDISPTPSTVLPTVPPTTPVTPKKTVKLVTHGSGGAQWFTQGFVPYTPTKESHEEEQEEIPEEKIDTSMTPEKIDHLNADLVNLMANPPFGIDPATALAGTAKMTRTPPRSM